MTCRGTGPCLFVPSSLGLVAHQSKIIIGIIKSIPNNISCHQPDLFMSCSLLAPNASPGINIPRPNNPLIMPFAVSQLYVPIIMSTALNITSASMANKAHHQNSARVDLLLKSKQCWKPSLMASRKLTIPWGIESPAVYAPKEVPHNPQNWSSSGLSLPHCGHFISTNWTPVIAWREWRHRDMTLLTERIRVHESYLYLLNSFSASISQPITSIPASLSDIYSPFSKRYSTLCWISGFSISANWANNETML